jgi:hypothetical protein
MSAPVKGKQDHSFEFVIDASLVATPRGTADRHPYKSSKSPRVPDDLKVEAGVWKDTVPLHGFVQAVHESFDCHYKLVLKPTDIWQLIIDGVTKTVFANADELRSKFVDHQGKEQIVVDRDDFVMGAGNKNAWGGVFEQFGDEIRKRVSKKSELPTLFTKNFSVSTDLTRLVSHITLMGSMQGYFKYVLRTRCGIPSVRLEGTVEDWSELLRRLDALKLHELKLAAWEAPLRFVLKQFEATRKGQPDLEFWKNFYNYEQGSGGDTVNGFMLFLFPDLAEKCTRADAGRGEAAVDTANLTSQTELYPVKGSSFSLGIVESAFVWRYHGIDYPMKLMAGFGDAEVCNNEVSTTMGWKAVYTGEPSQASEE